MAVLRFLSALFFLIALVACAADATPLLAGELTVHMASAHQRWSDIAPAVLSNAEASFSGHGLAWLWGAFVMPMLSLPAVALFGGLALVLGYAGRRRREIRVFVN
jgi:hypothetical protein